MIWFEDKKNIYFEYFNNLFKRLKVQVQVCLESLGKNRRETKVEGKNKVRGLSSCVSQLFLFFKFFSTGGGFTALHLCHLDVLLMIYLLFWFKKDAENKIKLEKRKEVFGLGQSHFITQRYSSL